MAGDGDLRVGPWAWAPRDTPGELAATEPPATDRAAGESGNWWDDLPDPWDRPPQPGAGDEEPTADIQLGVPGPARSGRDAAARRIAAVVLTVGAVLVGTGVLVTVLAPDREVVLAPPPAPPSEEVVTSPPGPVTDLGRAPTVGPSPGRPATGSPPPADPPSTPPPDTAATTGAATVSFEAEDAELGWFTDAYSEEAASGGSAVEMGTFLGMGGYIRFEEVSASGPGQYELTVHYLSEQDSTGLVTVNDGRSATVEFPGLDRDSPVGTVSVPVELVDGENTIVFEPDGGSAPDLDRLDVSR